MVYFNWRSEEPNGNALFLFYGSTIQLSVCCFSILVQLHLYTQIVKLLNITSSTLITVQHLEFITQFTFKCKCNLSLFSSTVFTTIRCRFHIPQAVTYVSTNSFHKGYKNYSKITKLLYPGENSMQLYMRSTLIYCAFKQEFISQFNYGSFFDKRSRYDKSYMLMKKQVKYQTKND